MRMGGAGHSEARSEAGGATQAVQLSHGQRTIADWLRSVDLAEYTSLFVQQQITLDVLPHLTESDVDRLGLPIGPRRRLVLQIKALADAERVVPRDARATIPPAPATDTYSAERRQLTVMFCDLVGSTVLAETLDPEELRELMQAYRTACGGVVERYGGYVAQYLGDGLMVYFGWPVAHEDDAERGLRSALEMVAAVKQIGGVRPLAVRIGLATGQVVVGDRTPSDNAEARLAVGGTPNLAARLQALAGPDEVVIAPTTQRLVAGSFSLTDLGERRLKGIAQPVQVWRVDEARRTEGRFTAAQGGKVLAPLLGRATESALLEECWRRASDGHGQVVFIGGQAGIGKSRLIQGVRAHIANSRAVLYHQCSPFLLNSPLHPFVEQIAYVAGFSRTDTPEQKLDKLEATLIGSPDEAASAAPLFAALLSLPLHRYPPLTLSPQKQKERTLGALASRIEARAKQGPMLMVVEDAHWLDPTSQEFLEVLFPRIEKLPVLLVITHRPEYVPPWREQPNVTTLALAGLVRNQGAALVQTVTQGRALPREVVDEILARTDGVPLFVEEVTRAILESGQLRMAGDRYELEGPLAALEIPASLRDSLMARLDRLGAAKEVAQIGACIGREFSYELLAQVSGLASDALEDSLGRLVLAGLVAQRGVAPHVRYRFKHALVQDTAYDSLLKSRRSELHGSIARVLEGVFADQVASNPEILAHHYTQAGQLDRAIPLWRQAGISAIGRVAMKEAVAHLNSGLALIEQLSPSEGRDRLELTIREPLNAARTGLSGWAAPEVGENAAVILRLAERVENAQSRLLATWWMWTTTITQGRIADSLTWVQRLLADGDVSKDVDVQMLGHTAAMVQYFLHGDLLASRAEADRALALYDPRRAARWIQLTGHDLGTFVEVYACQLLWVLGFPHQARLVSESSIARARAAGHAFNLVWALTFSAYVFAYRREPQLFLQRIDEADQVARDQGLAFISQVSVPQARGIAALQSKRSGEAVTLLRTGIQRWTDHGGHVRVPYLKSALAEATAFDGEWEGALELINQCLSQIEQPASQERLWLAEVLRIKGGILMHQGRTAEAEVQLRAAIACAREQHAKSWELRSSTDLGRLLASTGRRDEARALLGPVYAWFSEGWETNDLVEAKRLLDDLAI
jgi:class 3 adenylate cyclase/tetratricopeptide (TPR) repeat protein